MASQQNSYLVEKRHLNRVVELLLEAAYAEKWLVVATLIGVLVGLASAIFYVVLSYVSGFTAWILGVSNNPLSPVRDLAVLLAEAPRKYLIAILPAVGAGLGALIVYRYAREAEGAGLDATLDSFHRRAAIINKRVPFVKAVASWLTIGFGGSGGVLGPGVQIGGSVGSIIARILHMPLVARRIALVSGIAASLSALFRAPLGAALMAVEMPYKRDLEVRAIVPSIIASVVAYTITAPIFGFHLLLPRIASDPSLLYRLDSLAVLSILGVITGVLAIVFVEVFSSLKNIFRKTRYWLSDYLVPVLGGLLLGFLALLVPEVVGTGEEVMIELLSGDITKIIGEPRTIWLVLLFLALAKMVATGFSIGSGGSGGIEAPGLLIGALIGASYGYFISSYYDLLDTTVYAYIGMAAFFGAALKTPFSVSILLAEMSGNYMFIAPTLLVSIIAREVSREISLVEIQLRERLRSEILGAEELLVLLKSYGIRNSIKAIDIANRRLKPIPSSLRLVEAVEMMMKTRARAIPVVDIDKKIVGVIEERDLDNLLSKLEENLDAKIDNTLLRVPPIVGPSDKIEKILDEMVSHGTDYVLVEDHRGRYYGVIFVEDVVLALSHTIAETVLKTGRITPPSITSRHE